LPFGFVVDELWRPALGWWLSTERELLQVRPHRLRAQVTLALGGEGVGDTGMLVRHGQSFRDGGMLLKHGRVLSGDRSDRKRATRDRVTVCGQYGPETGTVQTVRLKPTRHAPEAPPRMVIGLVMRSSIGAPPSGLVGSGR
jgi:hypothetical protein